MFVSLKSFALASAVLLVVVSGSGTGWAQQQEESASKKSQVATKTGEAPREGQAADKSTSPPAAVLAGGLRPPVGYRVGADDELVVSVWHEPELSQTVVVRSDGMITLPLLNDIRVVGLTTEEMQSLLTEKLKALVNDPQVTIIVKAVKSQRVFIVGAVGKQGVYPVGGGVTVLQLIAQAGGLGPFAKSRSIYILRNQDGKQVRIPFGYKKALSGKGVDPVLQSGDMVVVP